MCRAPQLWPQVTNEHLTVQVVPKHQRVVRPSQDACLSRLLHGRVQSRDRPMQNGRHIDRLCWCAENGDGSRQIKGVVGQPRNLCRDGRGHRFRARVRCLIDVDHPAVDPVYRAALLEQVEQHANEEWVAFGDVQLTAQHRSRKATHTPVHQLGDFVRRSLAAASAGRTPGRPIAPVRIVGQGAVCSG